MPGASAGQEFTNEGTYSYKIDAQVADVQAFYKAQLEPQGWTQPVNAEGGEDGAILFYTKDSHFATITVTRLDTGGLVVILYEQ